MGYSMGKQRWYFRQQPGIIHQAPNAPRQRTGQVKAVTTTVRQAGYILLSSTASSRYLVTHVMNVTSKLNVMHLFEEATARDRESDPNLKSRGENVQQANSPKT